MTYHLAERTRSHIVRELAEINPCWDDERLTISSLDLTSPATKNGAPLSESYLPLEDSLSWN